MLLKYRQPAWLKDTQKPHPALKMFRFSQIEKALTGLACLRKPVELSLGRAAALHCVSRNVRCATQGKARISWRTLHLTALRTRETITDQLGVRSMVAEWEWSYSAESAGTNRKKVESSPMAYKSAVTRIEAQHIPAPHFQTQNMQSHRSASPEELRREFEKAMIEIHQTGFPADKKMQYRSPIVQRAKRLGVSQARAEECALSDAARALALLWKI